MPNAYRSRRRLPYCRWEKTRGSRQAAGGSVTAVVVAVVTAVIEINPGAEPRELGVHM